MFIEKLFTKDPSIKRHLAKTLTWRLVGTIDTIMLGWIVTGNPAIGLTIGGFEMFTKMLLYFLHERAWFHINLGLPNRERTGFKKKDFTRNITQQYFKVNRAQRNKLNSHPSFTVWFTGLSGAGKSTLANGLEQFLHKKGFRCYALDGDNIRLGINNDLGFSDADRKENIRRVAEIAKLMNDAGMIVTASFISPFKEDRELARKIIGADNFVEVFVDCPLDVCEHRDPKGLYDKARHGLIKDFTGVNSPYERPVNPELVIHSDTNSPAENLDQITSYLEAKMQMDKELLVTAR